MHNVPDLKPEHVANCRLFVDRRALLEIVPKGGVGVEMGVFMGDFSKILISDLAPGHLTLIDVAYAADVRKMFAEHIAAGKLTIVEADSASALEYFADRHFDWIYIDGDHSREGVARDAAVAKRKVKKDGILIFNDYKMGDHNYPGGFYEYGIIDAVNNLCIRDGYEMIGFAFHPQMYCDAALRLRNTAS